MSAGARGAAGYLCMTGQIGVRARDRRLATERAGAKQREAEDAAVALRHEREAKEKKTDRRSG